MRILICRILAVIALVVFLTSLTSQESHAQVTSLYKGSVKTHVKQVPRPKRPSTYQLPDGWIEVPKDGLPTLGRSNRERPGISPIPTPIPLPVPHLERLEISPVPTPIPLPVPYLEQLGISPVPTPIPRPVPDFCDPVDFPPLLDELIDMYADAMLRGDLDSADLIEELIIIVSEY